jgi:hypothetical protein
MRADFVLRSAEIQPVIDRCVLKGLSRAAGRVYSKLNAFCVWLWFCGVAGVVNGYGLRCGIGGDGSGLWCAKCQAFASF